MKKKVLYLLYICACVGLCFLASCKDDEALRPQPGLPGDTLATTLVFYIAGENSLASFMALDTAEVAAAMSTIPADARVVVFMDDNISSRISVGTRDTPMQQVKVYPDNVCATDSLGMLQVLRDITSTYPARHYALCLNSHASGWVDEQPLTAGVRRNSWGVDNGRRTTSNSGQRMPIPTLTRVLEQLPHWDYIFFDACFMQCIEVAYELRRATDYVIGSPAEIPGHGAPYQLLLPQMCQLPATDAVVQSVVRGYGDFYSTGAGASEYRGVELTAIATAGIEDFAAATRPLILRLFGGRNEVDGSAVQRYCPIRSSNNFTEFYDLGHLFYVHLPDDYGVWRQALDAVLPCRALSENWLSAYGMWGTYSPHFESIPDDILPYCAGLSVFVPSVRYDNLGWTDAYHSLAWYRAAGLSETGW